MIKEICPELFCIQVPLPNSPLRYLNSYVVRSEDRNLIIDTGLEDETCLEALSSGLKRLGIKMPRTDIFLTHFHADHIGLVQKLKTPETDIYFNQPETVILGEWKGFEALMQYSGRQGFPEKKLAAIFKSHPGSDLRSDWISNARILSEGSELNYGDYAFSCVETPGHTPGHICLYEPEKKILVSGDHVLIDISPNIQAWRENENPLKQYIKSLEKIKTYDVNLVLPGHRRQFKDLTSRVDQLIAHHEQRLDELRTIVSQTPKTAYEIASNMAWDIKADQWSDFPIAQQWFATGETLSHLRYLEIDGEIQEHNTQNIVRYSL